jgi:CRP-like cAMP-binding protein
LRRQLELIAKFRIPENEALANAVRVQVACRPLPGLGWGNLSFTVAKVSIDARLYRMQIASEFLQSVALFQDLNAEALSTLASLLISTKVSAGAVIFREADASDALYIVESGQIVISKHVQGEMDIVLTRFYRSDFFGEMGLFDAAPRSATAQAEADSILWRLDRKAFQQIFSDQPEMAARICYRLVTVFIDRLRVTNEQAREAIRWGLEATGYSLTANRAAFGRKSS